MSGTLSGHIDAVYQGFSSPLASTGSLFATAVGQMSASASMSGAGVLSGTAVGQRNSSAALNGAGALTIPSLYQNYFSSPALAGGGALAAVAIPGILPSLAGGSALSATAVPTSVQLDNNDPGNSWAGTYQTYSSPKTITWDHTVAEGANFLLVVVNVRLNGGFGSMSITYDGQSMTSYGGAIGSPARTFFYGMFDPPSGTHTVSATMVFTSTAIIHGCSASWFNVGSVSSTVASNGNGTNLSTTVPSTALGVSICSFVTLGPGLFNGYSQTYLNGFNTLSNSDALLYAPGTGSNIVFTATQPIERPSTWLGTGIRLLK